MQPSKTEQQTNTAKECASRRGIAVNAHGGISRTAETVPAALGANAAASHQKVCTPHPFLTVMTTLCSEHCDLLARSGKKATKNSFYLALMYTKSAAG